MGVTSREDVAIVQKDVGNSKSVSFAPRNIQFAHEFTGGETQLNLLALTTPSELQSAGFVNASASEIASANLSAFSKNLKLSLSRGLELIPFLHYLIAGNQIVFRGTLRDSGGALPGEILFGEVSTYSQNALVVGDVRWERGTVEVPVGTTLVNIGYRYRVNANPTQQVGDIKIKRNGVTIYRNVGNATASPSADGNFQEVDSGNGYGTTILLNDAPVGQSDIIEYEVGLKLASGELTIFDSLEKLQGQVLALAGDAAQGFYGDSDVSRYLAVAPSDLERRVFGDSVNRLLKLLDLDYVVSQEYSALGHSSFSSNNLYIPVLGTTRINRGFPVGTIANTAADGWSFTALMECNVQITYSSGSNSGFGFSVNATAPEMDNPVFNLAATPKIYGYTSLNNSGLNIAATNIPLVPGDVLRLHSQDLITSPNVNMGLIATAKVKIGSLI